MAAGSGRRFGNHANKLLRNLAGKPVVTHCLAVFLQKITPANLIMVIPKDQEEDFRNAFAAGNLPSESIQCVPGGDKRQDSVIEGLRRLPGKVEIAAIHDAARPRVSLELFRRCVQSARERGSGIAARRVVDTIKSANAEGKVINTLDRETLWAVETPQIFNRTEIESGYQQVLEQGKTVTDDAAAVELLGAPVYLVEHNQNNQKITYPEDLPEGS